MLFFFFCKIIIIFGFGLRLSYCNSVLKNCLVHPSTPMSDNLAKNIRLASSFDSNHCAATALPDPSFSSEMPRGTGSDNRYLVLSIYYVWGALWKQLFCFWSPFALLHYLLNSSDCLGWNSWGLGIPNLKGTIRNCILNPKSKELENRNGFFPFFKICRKKHLQQDRDAKRSFETWSWTSRSPLTLLGSLTAHCNSFLFNF